MRNFDIWILVIAIFLSCFGIFMIYSATQVESGFQGKSIMGLYEKQIVWLCIGLVGLIVFVIIPFRYYYAFAYIFYSISLLLLLGILLIPGHAKAHRWFDFSFFKFQPSELAKIATAFALAKFFANRRKPFKHMLKLWIPVVIVAVPLFLILVEPDLGTSLSFIALLSFMFFWHGVSILYLFFFLAPAIGVTIALTNSHLLWGVFFLIICLLFFLYRVQLIDILTVSLATTGVGLVSSVVWNFLKEYQRKRILTFLNPELDPKGAGWHIIQSKVALGSGGFWGKGWLSGTQKRLAFLPEQHTDFIFSTIGEEMGFIRVVIILSLYVFFIYRGIRIARESHNQFASLVAIGIVGLFAFHVFLNVGMTMGIAPVVGIPLPFLSYGGSSLVFTFCQVGILLNIGLRRYEY